MRTTYIKHKWTADDDLLFTQLQLSEIRLLLGLPISTLRARRVMLGLPNYNPKRALAKKLPPPEKKSWSLMAICRRILGIKEKRKAGRVRFLVSDFDKNTNWRLSTSDLAKELEVSLGVALRLKREALAHLKLGATVRSDEKNKNRNTQR